MVQLVSPWSVPVSLDRVPETGLHLEIEAPEMTLSAIAKLAGARTVAKLSAVFDLTRRGAGLQVDGRVSGRVGQTCVVTLEPIESEIAEDIDVRFVPQADEKEALEVAVGGEADADEEAPEPLIGGKVDLGAIATEFLILGIDPYPRKPGAEFAAPKVEDKGPHPFAALAALKKGPGEGSP